jgi:hypothetical protein
MGDRLVHAERQEKDYIAGPDWHVARRHYFKHVQLGECWVHAGPQVTAEKDAVGPLARFFGAG